MTAPGRKILLNFLVCSIASVAMIAGCGGGGSSSSSTGGALSITSTSLPNGNVGTVYSNFLLATGGTAPYNWTITSGTLQAGLNLVAGTGTILGTPTASGTAKITFQVTDGATPTAATATVTISLTVQNLNITTTSLPPGSIKVPYSATLTGTGGVAPYTWSLNSGTLPPGVTLCTATGTTCALSGTPTSGGVFTFSIKATDSESSAVTFTKNFTISLSPLNLLNNSLPNGLQGTPYSLTLSGTGGATPYTWSVSQGTLPGGLGLNTTTGVISGMPTGSGTYNFTIFVADAETVPETISKSYALTIVPSIGGSCAGSPTGNEALLNGNYALLVQGFEGGGSGTPVAIAASFAADHTGHVTGGDIDVSDAIGATHYTIAPYATATPVSLYTVGLDPTSSGNLGCVMLTTSVGTTMSFRFSLGGVSGGIASKGRIVEFDNPSGAGTVASGIMSRQTGTFATSSLSPAYAFGVDGEDLTGKPIAAAGSFSVSSANGNISSASADVDIAGTNSSALSGGTGTITGISATNGRGTASFSMSGTTFAWTIYIVNANQVYLISTASPAGGRALATSTSFSAPSGNYVAYSTGISSCSGTPCSDVNLARLTLNSGAASGTVWDYSISAGESSAAVSGGTYTTPGLSGRVAFTNTGSNGLISYLVSPAVDGISSITVGTDAGAHFGYMAAQPTTAAPSGQFIYGTLDPRYNTVTTYAGTATITPGGAFTGTEDESSQSGGLLSAVAASRTVTLGPNGTGSASVANGSSIAVTDGTRIFWFDFGNGAPPVITIAEPQ